MNGKKVTKKEIRQIIQLRKTGHSLPEIRKIVKRGNSTVFKYIEGIKILPKFRKVWKSRKNSSKWRSIQQYKMAENEAKKIVKNITKKEKILIAASLYWAEGSKGDFNLLNSDPDLIRSFVGCLKELGIEKNKLTVGVRVFDDLDIEKSCRFWANIIGTPRKNIKHVNILKGKKRGKLLYGMCRIRVVKGGYFLKLIKAIKDIIKNKI